eukprot:PhF_6_TR25436/c0_g1_i3/m.35156
MSHSASQMSDGQNSMGSAEGELHSVGIGGTIGSCADNTCNCTGKLDHIQRVLGHLTATCSSCLLPGVNSLESRVNVIHDGMSQMQNQIDQLQGQLQGQQKQLLQELQDQMNQVRSELRTHQHAQEERLQAFEGRILAVLERLIPQG